MSTVRIQVRRGTSSEWTTANPTLAAGEMGVETNTNKFKFGNGTDAWNDLSYAASDSQAIGEISQDAINAALTTGAGLTKTYNDGANTITINVDADVVATKAFATSEAIDKAAAAEAAAADYTDAAISGVNNSLTGYLETGDRGVANGVASLNGDGKIPESELRLDNLSAHIITSGNVSAENVTVGGNLVVNGTTTTLNTQNFTITDPLFYIGEDNESSQLDLGIVASHNDGTYNHTGLVRDASDAKWKLFKGVTDEPTTTINFSQGTFDDLALGTLEATAVNTTNITATGSVILPVDTVKNANIEAAAVTEDKLATNSVSNIKIQDAAINAAKIEGDAVISSKIQNNAVVEAKIANNAVTEDKIAINSVTNTKIADNAVNEGKIADNAITPNKIVANAITEAKITNSAVTSAKIANGSISDLHVASDAAIDPSKIAGLAEALDLVAYKEAPTFTGTVVLPSTTSIGDVSATEIAYVNGVTSGIQGQINDKASELDLTSHTSATANVHGIADTSLLATTANVATAKQEAIDAAAVASENYADGLASNYDAAGAATSAVTSHNNSTTSVHGIADTSKLVTTDAQSTTLDGALTVQGNLTVNGTTFNASATSITIEDNLVQLAHQNTANTVDLGLVVAYNDGTAKHSGIVRDVSDSKWKLFKDVTTEPSTTVDFAGGSLDDLAVNNLTAAGVVFSDKTQTKAGVPSLTTIATAVSSSTTLDALGTDAAVRDSLVPLSGSVNISFEATGNAKYEIGSSISFYQSSGTGANITGNGITILSTPGSTLRTTNSSVTATKIAATTWLLAGDLKA
jgi:hypothetical protein